MNFFILRHCIKLLYRKTFLNASVCILYSRSVRLFWRHLCDYASRTMKDVVPTYVRIPGDLKSQLDAAANHNARSRNGEIIKRLRDSFSPSGKSLAAYETADLVNELMRRYSPDELLIRIGKE